MSVLLLFVSAVHPVECGLECFSCGVGLIVVVAAHVAFLIVDDGFVHVAATVREGDSPSFAAT